MRSPRDFQGIFIHQQPVDMRKSINGLAALVQSAHMGDLMGPNLFVFCGKKRWQIKVLYFDKSGFALWQKRLEKERFAWPKNHQGETLQLSPEHFQWLLGKSL